jgi:HK97 family phage portal protein
VPSVLERISSSLRAAFLTPMALSLRDPALAMYLNGTGQSAVEPGGVITEGNALKIPAVWAAVQCIAGDVGSLPFFHYRRRAEGGKERASGSKLYKVLHDEFNPDMSAMIGRETMTAHVLLWGNAYAEIVRNELGQIVALYPIEPNRVQPYRETRTGPVLYRVQKLDGTDVVVAAERILHIVGLGFNGLMGYPVISLMRQALGVGAAAEALGGQVMQRGAKYSGFFEHPRTLGATAHKNLKESMATDLPGTYRILEEGMTYKPGSMPLKDAQFMEIRQYSVTDTARIFGIPPHKLGDLTHATFSNIEEQNIDYVIGTLRRWLVRWEQECNRKLIAPLEKTQQFCEHLVDGLLRGNIQSRYSAYSQGINNGFLSPNDIRTFENLDPIAGGDTYLVQGAMVPLDRLDDLVDAQVRPPPAPVPPPPAEEPGPPPEPAADDDRLLRVVEELRAEFVRRTAALPAALVAALPPAPPAVLAAPPDAPAAAVQALVADLRAESRATMLGVVAGKLVRREVAQLRKRAADPTAAIQRLEKFYQRFVGEGAAELTPWVPNPAAVLTPWADAAMRSCVAAVQLPGGLETLLGAWARDREADLRQLLVDLPTEEAPHG